MSKQSETTSGTAKSFDPNSIQTGFGEKPLSILGRRILRADLHTTVFVSGTNLKASIFDGTDQSAASKDFRITKVEGGLHFYCKGNEGFIPDSNVKSVVFMKG